MSTSSTPRQHRWTPQCSRPPGLIHPSRIDAAGVAGPTRGRAAGPFWTSCAPGLYVPTDRPDVVEQRIVEQAGRLFFGGAVTAWAALRWHGASFFDGLAPGGIERLPVPLLLGPGGARPHHASTISKAQLAPREWEVVDGVPVTIPCRALFDEVVRRGELWEAVTAVEMACAGGVVTVDAFRDHVSHRPAWEGVPGARKAAGWARGDLRSPREVWMHLVWELVAGFPRARANVPLFGLDGTFLAMPDLVDVEAGLVGEYDGAHHLDHEQRRTDVVREDRLRSHGLEYVAVVRGETRDAVAHRFTEARRRALSRSSAPRAWTLDPPPWWSSPW